MEGGICSNPSHSDCPDCDFPCFSMYINFRVLEILDEMKLGIEKSIHEKVVVNVIS